MIYLGGFGFSFLNKILLICKWINKIIVGIKLSDLVWIVNQCLIERISKDTAHFFWCAHFHILENASVDEISCYLLTKRES